MAKKKLTIKGITFPDFGKDKSKKNFRLVFYIGYTDKNGDEAVAVVSKPTERHWQWKNPDKDAYLQPKIVGDSAELDTSVLKTGDGGKISASSNKITDIDGKITDIRVQFMDVHDKTPIDVIVKTVLPQLIDIWKASGIDPVDFVPGAPVIKVLLKDNANTEELVNKAQEFFKKKLKDKTLHTISKEYDGEKTLTLKDKNVAWGDDGKTGTYAVTIGVA